MTTDIVLSPAAPLAVAAHAADAAAARSVFAAYRQRRAANTLRRQNADLALFAQFLQAAGVATAPTATDPLTWSGVTWGLLAAFVQWQLTQGYAIGSINVRLATIKAYCKLAMQAGTITTQEYALIKVVQGFRHREGRQLDRERETTRVGAKKAAPTPISTAQARLLKEQDDPGDALLMCLLLDHGLRCGEIVPLQVGDIDTQQGTLVFYREKVDLTQTHELTMDTLRAALRYVPTRSAGPLFDGKQRDLNRRVGQLGGALGLEKLSPHDCRHYWATAALRGGTDLKSLQDAGGWTSPAMPLRYAESRAVANKGVRLR